MTGHVNRTFWRKTLFGIYGDNFVFVYKNESQYESFHVCKLYEAILMFCDEKTNGPDLFVLKGYVFSDSPLLQGEL